MASYHRHEIVTGAFVLAALATFAAFAFKVGDFDPLGVLRPAGFPCRAYFADVKTLDEGAKVTVAGRRVGSVRRLRIADVALTVAEVAAMQERAGPDVEIEAGMCQARVEVDFELDDPALRFDPASARVSLVQDGFLGRHFLALEPGFWTAEACPPPLRERRREGTVAVKVTESPGIEQLLATVQPVVRRIDALLESVQTGVLDERGIARTRQALEDIGELIAAAAALLDTESQDGVHALVLRPLQQLLAKADSSLLPQAERLLASGGEIAASARQVLTAAQGVLERGGPKAEALLAELHAAAADLDQRLAAVQADVQQVLGDAHGILADNRAELAETTRRLRRTMWQAEMAMRKIRANPAFLLFGDAEQVLDAEPQDASALTRTGRARPYGQRDEEGKDEG